MKKFFLCIILLFQIAFENTALHAAGWADLYMKWRGPKNPLLGIEYGYGQMNNEAFKSEFNNTEQIDVKLGYTREFKNDLCWMDELFFTGSFTGDELFNHNSNPELAVNSGTYSAGFGIREGFAYDLNKIYLYPYTGYSFQWSKVKFSSQDVLGHNDTELLGRYEDSVRFGYAGEAGIAIGVSDRMDVRAGYNFSMINPRVVFMEFAASHVIEYIGYNIISSFAFNMLETSTFIGPVMYAVLRGAYLYAFHCLRKNGMDWPFLSEKPLTTEMFKFGFMLRL